MDRYLLTATLRRDGSSRFEVKTIVEDFPSAAQRTISNEPFMALQKMCFPEFKITFKDMCDRTTEWRLSIYHHLFIQH